MTYASSRPAEPGSGNTLSGRRADRPRRPFFVLACCDLLFSLLLAACALAPATVEPAVAHKAETAPQVVDSGGAALTPRQADAAVRRLGRESDSQALARQFADSAIEAPLTLGNEARLLIDGPQTHEAMFKAIAQARREIDLETYILGPGEPGQRLAELLIAKRAQGLTVRVLHDSVGSMETPPEYFKGLREGGVGVCEFNPINPLKADTGWQINNRDHRKLLIVDGQLAFTGGINISSAYLSGSFSKRGGPSKSKEEGWRDTHVQVRGPVVADFQRLFFESWEGQNCDPPLGAHKVSTPGRAGDQAMRVVAADPRSGQSELYLLLLSAIDHAKTRVWLTYGYFVPDQRMLEALTRAAGRGVDVRLMLPGFSDFWAVFHAGRSRYQDLLEARVRIFERRDALLHAKSAVIDGAWSSIGSTNLDWRSFVHNYEADLVVLDPGFGDAMEDLFRRDEEASHEVTLQEWEARDIGTRFKEWLAQRWEYLL